MQREIFAGFLYHTKNIGGFEYDAEIVFRCNFWSNMNTIKIRINKLVIKRQKKAAKRAKKLASRAKKLAKRLSKLSKKVKK